MIPSLFPQALLTVSDKMITCIEIEASPCLAKIAVCDKKLTFVNELVEQLHEEHVDKNEATDEDGNPESIPTPQNLKLAVDFLRMT